MIRVEGAEEVARQMDLLELKAREGILRAVVEVIGRTEKEAKKKVPVDTGALKSSIEGKVTNYNPLHIQGVVGAGQKSIRQVGPGKKTKTSFSGKLTYDYAHFVEYAPVNKAYMKQAYNFAKDKLPKLIRKGLRKIYG